MSVSDSLTSSLTGNFDLDDTPSTTDSTIPSYYGDDEISEASAGEFEDVYDEGDYVFDDYGWHDDDDLTPSPEESLSATHVQLSPAEEARRRQAEVEGRVDATIRSTRVGEFVHETANPLSPLTPSIPDPDPTVLKPPSGSIRQGVFGVEETTEVVREVTAITDVPEDLAAIVVPPVEPKTTQGLTEIENNEKRMNHKVRTYITEKLMEKYPNVNVRPDQFAMFGRVTANNVLLGCAYIDAVQKEGSLIIS
jgi:hypothetical protein